MLALDCHVLPSALGSAYQQFENFLDDPRCVAGPPETAVGAPHSDAKRYVEFDGNTEDTVPDGLVALRHLLCKILDDHRDMIEASIFPGGPSGQLDRLVDWPAGPKLRFNIYPESALGTVNHPHCDMDLFTLLPAATKPGLEAEIDGAWMPAPASSSTVWVLPGEMAGYFGGRPCVRHRVVSSGSRRMSASLFVNAASALITPDGVSAATLLTDRLKTVWEK